MWGPCASTCLVTAGLGGGGLALVLLLAAGAALGASWTRARIGRRFDRRIAEVYELIRAKAEAARSADYADVPAEAFALYHALRDELFELAGVGAAVQAVKDAVMTAAAQSSPSPPEGQARPVKGAMVLMSLPPPNNARSASSGPAPYAALRRAVDEFWEYWSNRPRVERQLRQAVRNLGGELVVREPLEPGRMVFRFNSAGNPPRAPSPARPRSRPASP